MAAIQGVLIDLGGVVYQAEDALPGAAGAIAALKQAGIPVRFLTNTTSEPLSAIHKRMKTIGIPVEPREIFTPARAARIYIEREGYNPVYLIRPTLYEDFDGVKPGRKPALVIADAREGFTYDALNAAYRRLEAGATLLALASNRIFLGEDGQLSLDLGAYVAALEYATGKKAVVLGKPSVEFFHLAVADMGIAPADAAMIGDDAEFDAVAAREAGLAGYLVRTGKWKAGDAAAAGLPGEFEFDNLAAVVDHLLAAP